MKLFLIRHGETEHNVACLLAGVTDSVLTNHGVLQTQRLAKYLTSDCGLRFTHLLASDLQRAYMTADAIQNAQAAQSPNQVCGPVKKLAILRERDFGSLECKHWSSTTVDENTFRLDPGFVPKETDRQMDARAELFLDDYLIPLLASDDEELSCVGIVSHGLFLGVLWRALILRFQAGTIRLDQKLEASAGSRPLGYLPAWMNTAFLELDLVPANTHKNTPGLLVGWNVLVKTVNGTEHLTNLRRTRGGVGSARHDPKQTNLESFFKKQNEETKA